MEFASGSGRNRLIGELSSGREMTVQLRSTMSGARNHVHDVLVLEQIEKILYAFNESLSILTSESDEVSEINSSGRTSEDTGKSRKTPATSKVQRGCYKRRRNSETRTIETPSCLIDDGNAWRKYGQKVILNAPHARNYFRCTHKFEQDCKATKHVQKIQDDPPLFRTTYYGHHTCNKVIKSESHQITMDSPAQDDSAIIWSFDQNSNEEINCQINNNESSSSLTFHDYYKSPHEDLATTFESANNSAGFSVSENYYGINYTSVIDPMDGFDDFLISVDEDLIS